MKIQRFMTVAVLGALVALMGCNQGTSGGPGATSPPTKDRMGQTDDTFSMVVPSLTLEQGERKIVSIGIKRGQNFSEDVSLKLDGLPTGVTLDPANPAIARGETEVKLTMKAADNAALGDFTVKVTAHPTKGADATSEMSITVAQAAPVDTAPTAAEAAKAKWDESVIAMQDQWEQLKEKYAALQERAANAEGQAKVDLDLKVEAAKVKMDAAAVKLEEMKTASADRWDKVKEGASNAFAELKTMFD